MHTLTVKGVYSDFKNKKEILEYYNSNKDFYNLDYFETIRSYYLVSFTSFV